MDALPESGVLLTISQIAATFVGFSTVYFVFSRDRNNEQRRLFLRSVAETGLAATGGGLLPLFVAGLTTDSSLAWRISAAIFVMTWVLGWTTDSMKYWKQGLSASFTGKIHSPDNFLNVGGIALLLWVVIGAPAFSGTLYAISMACVLAISAGCFVAGAFAGQDDAEKQE